MIIWNALYATDEKPVTHDSLTVLTEQNFQNWLNLTCQKNREDGILSRVQSFVFIRCEKLPAEEIFIIKMISKITLIITDKTKMPWKLEEIAGYLFIHI